MSCSGTVHRVVFRCSGWCKGLRGVFVIVIDGGWEATV